MRLIENYDFEYRDLLDLRRRALESREKVEKEYDQEIYNLGAWEYDIEAAKAVLRNVKSEARQLIANNEHCKLSNAKKVRLSQLTRLRQRAIGKLKYAKSSRERVVRNIRYDKAKLQRIRVIESTIKHIQLWAYNEIMKTIYESDVVKSKEFRNQPLEVRQSKIYCMEFAAPVKLKITMEDHSPVFMCDVEAYGQKRQFSVYVKMPDLENTYGL